ncbi:GNAT family N-acetyltransferase [Loigolactobacillus backii]|uniref:GNAT family acetyltransferase n=1 Tax=Loigolactobacillus backii TaxID=375175 RepID=A0A192H310_9LACO|nr:N-acetyltransferase [Loigolactobacillus backii]ANK59245.1 GNAT family acetyltransferase [Loigolactobacillus backii]ANK62658.1 GNAT family acetyltransferase [Loigolactobacillus backii]ANK64236.1 GNAT family acetyltransferase [Loigolactobacillus backii]ANK67370.1 GNAT family acetyltransferase [Loigolactobacillus backii]ANK70334.1 GNAT family acetyltransferase [Loigolactobacillus backii]
MKIRHVRSTDLPALLDIEHAGFSPAKAATKAAFENRIATISDTFFVAEVQSQVVGFINGPVIDQPYISDDLFDQTQPNPTIGGYQSVLGLAVAPSFRQQGIARALLKALEKDASAHGRQTITLTCEERLITFYETAGFTNAGVATSTHGQVTWYNMVKPLGGSL